MQENETSKGRVKKSTSARRQNEDQTKNEAVRATKTICNEKLM